MYFPEMFSTIPGKRMMRFKGTMILLTSHCMQSSSCIPLSTSSKYSIIHSSRNILPLERPPDPSSTHSNDTAEAALNLRNWMQNKKSILCLTGAGMSTESGIPDYRGHKGSYFNGHKPVSTIYNAGLFTSISLLTVYFAYYR
jgi:hypothetical protein